MHKDRKDVTNKCILNRNVWKIQMGTKSKTQDLNEDSNSNNNVIICIKINLKRITSND